MDLIDMIVNILPTPVFLTIAYFGVVGIFTWMFLDPMLVDTYETKK